MKLASAFHSRDESYSRGGGGELMWTRRVLEDVSTSGGEDIFISISLPTLKPPMRWSLLNSLPFLYHFRVGVGLPLAWQRNFTVLLAGTA